MDFETLAHPADPIAAYVTGQRRPSQGPLIEAFDTESAATLDAYRPALDIPYGRHPREVFDLYASDLPWRGTLAYLHAGYWQSRDKVQFRFLAPPFLAHGIDVVLVNYPLCPDVTIAEIVVALQHGIPKILSHRRAAGRGGEQLVAAGHSAGAHLAVELALTDWAARGLPRTPIGGIMPISGVYELTPLIATPLNDNLHLDAAGARTFSPIHRVRGPLPPALFAVGGLETPEFQAQTEAMHVAWKTAGGGSSLQVIEGADHFSILRALGVEGALFSHIQRLVTV